LLRTSERTVGVTKQPRSNGATAPPVTSRAPSCTPWRVRPGRRGRDRLGLGQPLARDEQSRQRDAGLAAVEHAAPDARGHGQLEVCVIEHDAGGLAAELQRRGDEAAAGDLADVAADAFRAGERDEVDAGVVDQCLADDLP
jgi:hypothetical protein